MAYLQSIRHLITSVAAGVFIYAGCGGEEEQNLVDCLIEKNVKLYSAWWCGPCEQQKEELQDELGAEWNNFKENIFVECYDAGYKGLEQCEGKKIYAYPAWEIPGGNPEWLYGVQDLETIAEIASCEYNSLWRL